MDESNNCNNEQRSHLRKDWGFTFVGGTADLEVDPTGKIVASLGPAEAESQQFSLARTKAGDRVWITTFKNTRSISRLYELGLSPGAELQVISCITSGSVIVAVQDRRLGLGASTASQIFVTDDPVLGKQYKQGAIAANTHLRDLPVGSRGCIVGYDRAFRGYMGKLLAMGLQPGTAFTVIRHALFGHLVEIEVQGFTLSLRKPEADALCVEEIEED